MSILRTGPSGPGWLLKFGPVDRTKLRAHALNSQAADKGRGNWGIIGLHAVTALI